MQETTHFHGGARELFDTDAYGSDVIGTDLPTDPASSAVVFQRTGDMLAVAFQHARQLGIQTALGTELPLGLEPKGPEVGVDWVRGMPPALQERLRSKGMDPSDPEVVKAAYRGTFQRIMQTHPLDHYWFWTWEGWSMYGVSRAQIQAVLDDFALAHEAAAEVGAPFSLALGGWIVGTAENSAEFDDDIPLDIPFFGLWDEASGFDELQADRIKWPATWLEEDWGLAQPQLEMDRIHRDVRAALETHSHGIIAKHWRTRILGPNVHALKALTWAYGPTGSALTSTVEQPLGDFVDAAYQDWATRQFGEAAGPGIGAVLARLDQAGEHSADRLPTPLGWDEGAPVAILVPEEEGGSWEKASARYAFVDELEALQADVVGPGNQERYAYWLASFQVLRLMGQYSYALQDFETAIDQDQGSKALEARLRLARLWEEIMALETQKATNCSDLGEIVNLDTLNWYQLMEQRWDKDLTELVGPLPDDASPSQEHSGPARVVVTTARTIAYQGETLQIEAIVLGGARTVTLHYRPMGIGDFVAIPLKNKGRSVWGTALPDLQEDTEYYVRAETDRGEAVFPAAAPALSHTVVVLPAAGGS